MTELVIPANLLPVDGRFGSGPAKIRADALTRLGSRGEIMGTSHRQAPVRKLVQHVQEMLAELYRLPEGYQVVLGNGGATLFWDMATSCLIRQRSAYGVCGEFSKKFADSAKAAPFLDEPYIDKVEYGTSVVPAARADVDLYGWAQNETSTGAVAPVLRPEGAGPDSLVVIDATSAAGGMDADLTQDPMYVPAMVDAWGEGADVVIASRFRHGSKVHGLSWDRHVMTWGARMVVDSLMRVPGVRDYSCGFRLYDPLVLKAAFDALGDGFVTQTGFACMVEIIAKLRGSARIAEVPFELRYDAKRKPSAMRIGPTVRSYFTVIGQVRGLRRAGVLPLKTFQRG